MAEEAGEKTEAPSAKRLRDAREKGDVLKSKELATALSMLAGVGWVIFLGPKLVAACRQIMAACFQFGRADVEDFSPARPLLEAGSQLILPLATLFAVAILAAIASQAALGGLGWNNSLLAPKANRINPVSGLARIFGPQGWIELGKSLLKVALLGSIGVWLLLRLARPTLHVAHSDLGTALGSLGSTLTAVLVTMSLGLVAIAGLDVPIAIFRRLAKLRMTKQEVRDEHKETEGSPELKGHIRARQREVLRGGARKAVAEAHVVLTNPTHFAVALRYDRGTDQVPVVVAKGRGATALAIREIAAEVSVPVLEYPQLARAVYYTSREGQEVRDDLYQAIATVLAFVFGLNAQRGGIAQPPVIVPDTARYDEHGHLSGAAGGRTQ
jgi:flagellar biosynthesis protein FlhB